MDNPLFLEVCVFRGNLGDGRTSHRAHTVKDFTCHSKGLNFIQKKMRVIKGSKPGMEEVVEKNRVRKQWDAVMRCEPEWWQSAWEL